MQNFQKKPKAHLIFILLTLLYFLIYIFINRNVFTKTFDYKYFGNIYSKSQYVLGPASKQGIGDDGLFAFAGYYYITGGDISQVNFENPPLGKYLIGVSEIVFKNQSTINIIYALLLFLVVYKIGEFLLKEKILASAALFLVSIDKVITNQFIASSLDLPQTVAFLFGFYFILKTIEKPDFKKSALAALFFSLSFVMKFFPILIIILGATLLFLFIYKKWKTLKYFALSLIIIFPAVYLLSHLEFFFNHSILEFIKYQYWIIKWREGNAILPGNFFVQIFTGYYFTWYSNHGLLRFSDEWSPEMSAVVAFGIVGLWLWRKRLENKLTSIVVVAFIIYVAALTTGSPKFLMSVYPLFSVATIYTLSRIFDKLKLSKKNGKLV